jgi:hypothetical protein
MKEFFYFNELDIGESGRKQVIPGVTDEKGNLPERTKHSYPYSYDPICQYYDDQHYTQTDGTVYHDHMQQWDSQKFAACRERYSGRVYDWMSDGRIMEAFLRDYFDKPDLKLTAIIEYCNMATGYPCFRFDYIKEVKQP